MTQGVRSLSMGPPPQEAADDARCGLRHVADGAPLTGGPDDTMRLQGACTLLSALELLCDWRGAGRNRELLALVQRLAQGGGQCVSPLNSLFFDFDDVALLGIARAAFRS